MLKGVEGNVPSIYLLRRVASESRCIGLIVDINVHTTTKGKRNDTIGYTNISSNVYLGSQDLSENEKEN